MQKVLISLASAKNKVQKDRDLVSRWFADENTDAAKLDEIIEKLTAGFKKIRGVCNSNQLVFSDGTVGRSTQPNLWKTTYTLVHDEKLHVIYVEKVLLGRSGTKLEWAFTIVHELSHREIKTKDHFYSESGLKPNAGSFPSDKVIDNADNWGLLCRKCQPRPYQGQNSGGFEGTIVGRAGKYRSRKITMLIFKRIFFIFFLTILGFQSACSESAQQPTTVGGPELKQAESNTMNTIGSRRRRLPPELEPVTVDGLVYKELRQGNKLGYEQKSGFLVAQDQKTGQMLWHVSVYPIHYVEGKETDVQEVFFTRMELLPGEQKILIENELEKQFMVDLTDRSVTEK